MGNLKFRYTFKRKSDGHLYELIVPLGIFEDGHGEIFSMLKNELWELVAKERFSEQTDGDGADIYENDVLTIETKNHKHIKIVCEFGIARRTMDSGWEVDIPSFYFRRDDGLLAFPIVRNWAKKHDLKMMRVVGHIRDYPELALVKEVKR